MTLKWLKIGQKVLFLTFLMVGSVYGQNVRQDGVVQSRSGQPAGGASIAVCSQPAVTTTLPCSPRVPLCLTLTDVVCSQPNPVLADGLGNYHFYVSINGGPYTIQFYGPTITPYIQPDITFGSGSATQLFSGIPFGSCNPTSTAIDTTTGLLYDCFGSIWHLVGPGTSNLVSPVTTPNPFEFDVNLKVGGPNPYVDATACGGLWVGCVRAIPASSAPAAPGITVSCTSGSPNVTISNASSFQNKDGVALYGCGPNTIAAPAAPTVVPSVLAAQTGLLLDVNGPVGATQYCYQLVASTLMHATNVSPETCTNTGPASLGLQTNSITSCTLVLQVMTCLTSAPHGLVVGAQIVVTGTAVNTLSGQANGSSAVNPFSGWFRVATVPDNTHFTVSLFSDTRNGAVASSTGGTLSYWNSIHITATELTNNYQYAVYGRVTGGTKTLIGLMWPQDVNLFQRLSDVTYLAFDDLGSTVTTLPNKPFYLPTTVPTVGTNDMLSSIIISGGGTTNLTLANNAGNTIGGQTILFDDAVTMLAAANYAKTDPNQGQLMLPDIGTISGSLAYVFNSPIVLPQGLALRQKGLVRLNEPVFTNGMYWLGETTSLSVNPSFATIIAPQIQFNACSPCIMAQHKTIFNNLTWTMLSGNGSIGFMQESGGIPDGGAFRYVEMSTGSGANTYSNMAMVFRGDGAGFEFENNTLVGTQNANLVGTTPGIYFDLSGNASFRNLNMSGIGVAARPTAAGAYIKADNWYCQACYEPYLSVVAAPTDPLAVFVASFNTVTFDTNTLPLLANYGGHAVYLDFINTGAALSNDPFVTGSNATGSTFPRTLLRLSGVGYNPINIGSSISNSSALANDGTFGRVILPLDFINKSQAIGPGFSFFTTTGPPAAMTGCAVSAGGSVPVGTNFYFYAPIYANGSEGTMSLYCLATTSGGNQTVTLNWTAIAGVTQYNVYRGLNQTNVVLLNNSPITGTTLMDTLAVGNGASPITAGAGGPAGMHGGMVWGTQINLSTNISWTAGAGVPPAGTCTAANGGSLYSRTDGGTTTTLYVCDNSTHVWTAK